MKFGILRWTRGALTSLVVAACLGDAPKTFGALEQTFETLQIGTQAYRNVTVTTKSKSYVFILHAGGMTNLKVAELPADVREKLGYPDPATPKVATNGASAWAKQTLAKLESPKIKGVEEKLKQQWNLSGAGARMPMPQLSANLLLAVAGLMLAIYLFYCFCCMKICQKAGSQPGFLVWVPILQLFPLLRAAGMSPLWFLAYLVPVLNVIAQVLWCFRIADARGKSAFTAILLLLPITSLFAFLYLAFADGEGTEKKSDGRRIQLMTLEAA